MALHTPSELPPDRPTGFARTAMGLALIGLGVLAGIGVRIGLDEGWRRAAWTRVRLPFDAKQLEATPTRRSPASPTGPIPEAPPPAASPPAEVVYPRIPAPPRGSELLHLK